jgi:hypothetical protein
VRKTISQIIHLNIRKSALFCLTLLLFACNNQKTASTNENPRNSAKPLVAKSRAELPKMATFTHQNRKIRVRLAITDQEVIQGLSGVQNSQFDADEAMFFYFHATGIRGFWMPDTYFNLDIFFLDKDLKILDVHRNLQHHPGRQNYYQIPTSRKVTARHVLEMRADSPIAAQIKIGDKLTWSSVPSLEQIEPNIRRLKLRRDDP